MGKRKAFLPCSLTLSAISSLIGLVPYFLIWVIIRKFFNDNSLLPGMSITACAWWATGAALLSVLFYYASLIFSHLAAFRVESNLRRESMERIIRMPMGFYNGNTLGKIRKVIDDNASLTHTFLAHEMPDITASMAVPAAIVVLVFTFNWKLGLVCLVPIIGSGIAMMSMMGQNGVKWMREYMSRLEDMNTEAVEYVRGIPVVKVFQQTIFSFKNFYRSIMDYNQSVKLCTHSWRVPMTFYIVCINSFTFLLVPVALLLVAHGGNVQDVLTDYIFFVLLTPFFSQCIMRSSYLSSAERQSQEVLDRLEKLTAYEPLKEPEHPQQPANADIAFNRVSFTYPEAAVKAVDGVSFQIPEGSRVALVGASGGGKSTIARLLPRFWDVQEGSVTIGGVDVRDIAQKDLMEHISIVFQNVRLFKTTLRDNIRLGRPDASEEEINRAIDAAQAREIIDRLPQGLETKIGTEGTYLSDGEQQRIVLARAILKNAPIVVLDEATAFADPENEQLIQKALKELTQGKTILMIAHRLSSVTDADQILVVEEGKVAESGTHTSLLARKGIYARMWEEYNRSIEWTIGKKEVCHD